MTCGWAASIPSHNQKIFLSCVLAKQKRTPISLQTTINATYTVPVATLSKGNERMTKIKIFCGLSQQCNWVITEEKKSTSHMEDSNKRQLLSESAHLGPCKNWLLHCLVLPGVGDQASPWECCQIPWRSKENPIHPKLMRLWEKEEISLSSSHHFCYLWRLAIQNLKKPLNYFGVHF